MRRRTFLRAGAAAGPAATAGCTSGYTEPRFDGSFENGLDGWGTEMTHYVDDVTVELAPR